MELTPKGRALAEAIMHDYVTTNLTLAEIADKHEVRPTEFDPVDAVRFIMAAYDTELTARGI